MRHYLGLFLAASFLWMSQALLASSHDDDNDVVPASAAASRAPDLNPDDAFSRFPTHVLRQIGDILLENDFQSLGRFLKVSRATNALKDQIFHTTQTMGTSIIDGKERTAMHYAGANNTKDRVLELLGRQTGNPELFKKDHARDYQNWSKTDLLKLLKNKTLEGALDVNTSEGKAYFSLKAGLQDASVREVDYSNSGLLLCPPLGDATHLESLDLNRNQLTTLPSLNALINLQWVDLSDNQLTAAPVVMGLTQLEMLILSSNKLTVVPDLTGLMTLKGLFLSYNKLNATPVLTGLRNLQGLYLHHNKLNAVPDVTGLTNLEQLCLHNNQIIADPVVTGLRNLETLNLSNNHLIAAPDVTGLPNLEWLYLDAQLCQDQQLLKTLGELNKVKTPTSKPIKLLAISKDGTKLIDVSY